MTSPAQIAPRLDRLRARLDTLGVDALLVTTPSNRRWISGFTGSAGVALVTRSEARFATDSRYWEQVGLECPDYTLVHVTGANTGVTPEILEGLGGRPPRVRAGARHSRRARGLDACHRRAAGLVTSDVASYSTRR